MSAYRELELSFVKKYLELLKAFEFHTLWEPNNPLSSFRRLATESAYTTGRLNGDVEFTKLLNYAQELYLEKAADCLTKIKRTRKVMKWTFDKARNKKVSYIRKKPCSINE